MTDEVTFLGAHVVPDEYKHARDEYVSLVAGEMMAACDDARWVDVFCDQGAFSVDEARVVLEAGRARGKLLRLHGNQLGHTGGVALAVALGAASVDHCTHVNDDELDALSQSDVVATLLPGAEFSTRSPYPSGRRFIDAGVRVALATDCNPGTSYVTSMSFVIALAVRDMGMTVDEALWSATRGGAMALRRPDIGHLSVGARADLAILDAPRVAHLAYRPGSDLIYRVLSASSPNGA
jgi:imidazolonepropionase